MNKASGSCCLLPSQAQLDLKMGFFLSLCNIGRCVFMPHPESAKQTNVFGIIKMIYVLVLLAVKYKPSETGWESETPLLHHLLNNLASEGR